MSTTVRVSYDGFPERLLESRIAWLAGAPPSEICFWVVEEICYLSFMFSDSVGAEIAVAMIDGREIAGRKIRARLDRS